MNEERTTNINLLKKSIKLINQNKTQEAEKILINLSKFKDFQVDTFLYLGICNIKKKKNEKAIEFLKKSLKLNPDHEYANLNLGLVYFSNKNLDTSLKYIKKSLDINNKNQLAIYHIGLINLAQRKFDEAENFFLKLLEINSNDSNALLNLGIIYNKTNNRTKSVEMYEKLIKIKPNNIYAYNNLGLTYFDNLNFDKAIECYENCIKIDPKFISAYGNLGRTYLELRNFDKALLNFNKVKKINPTDYNNLFAIGKTYLSMEKYDEGFRYYEYRKYLNNTDAIRYVKKNYNSDELYSYDIVNKKILILSEQGFGDTIQFSRYLDFLKKNNEIIFLINKKLNFLFKNSNLKLINNLEEITEHDYFQNLLSLPKIYYENKKSFVNNINYIKTDKDTDSKWSQRLKNINKLKIGIFWQGNKNYYGDDKRSIPLHEFEQIIKNNKYSIISLQKNLGVEQIKQNNYEKYILDYSLEIDNNEDAYKDSISILRNLDLVITSDSSIAHLAATMNINTWIALSYNPDWRWYIEIKKSVFYNTIKIFQQKKPGNWQSVFDEINNALLKYKSS